MFRKSFFYRYLSPFAGTITLNIVLRMLSALFNIALLLGIVPFLSILFGQAEAVTQRPETIGFSAESALEFMKYELSKYMLAHGNKKTLTLVVLVIGAFYLLKNLFAYLALYAFVPIKNGVIRDVRKDLYSRLLILPLSFFSRRQKGDLLARVTADVEVIDKEILTPMEQVFVDIILVVMMLASLFFLNVQLAIFTFLLLPGVTMGISMLSRKLKSTSTQMQGDLGRLMAQTEETLGGLKAIKSYCAEPYFRGKFEQRNNSFYRLANAITRRQNLASPVSEFLGTIAIMAILLFGGWLILRENRSLSPEILLTFLLFLTQILNPAKSISSSFYALKRGKASVRRIKTILNADEKIVEKPNATGKPNFDKDIVFNHISFCYETLDTEEQTALQDDSRVVLNNLSLTFEKNKYYAIVGPSGAGKTTIADLLGRFYDCTEGQILIDGTDIRDMVIADVRALSAYVSQDTILFNDTIANNITFGRADIPHEDIVSAAKAARAHDFIMNTNDGYNSMVGDSGVKLSGGQRQRLSIARAILKHAPILILDEATSALDTETERLVQDAISELSKTHTTIAIAHRLSTIQHADKIIVMNDGKIEETGTHSELLANNGLYAKLCKMQTV